MKDLKKQIEKMEAENNWFADAIEKVLTEESIGRMEQEVQGHSDFLQMMKEESTNKNQIPVISFKWDMEDRTVKFQVGISEKDQRLLKSLI